MTTPACPSYAGCRFPAEIISRAVWLYFRFPLSLCMVDELLAARGIVVSHETVRQRARKFDQAFTNQIRCRLPAAADKWHMDEVVITISGVKHWLWRAFDQNGMVLDILVQSSRDTLAAKHMLRKRQCRPPHVTVTDKLASYEAAKREVLPSIEHRKHKGLNNRTENSGQPTPGETGQHEELFMPRRVVLTRCLPPDRAVIGRVLRGWLIGPSAPFRLSVAVNATRPSRRLLPDG